MITVKKYLLLICFFVISCLSAQFNKAKVSLKTDWKEARTFKGSIAGKNITLYLQYGKHSGWHDKVYSVEGYYYYDAIRKKIPLVGFYNGSLMLYNFGVDHLKKSKEVLNEDLFCWTKPCPFYAVFAEYIKISPTDGKVQKGTLDLIYKKYDVNLWSSTLDVTPHDEWLKLPTGKTLNLRELIDEYGGNHLISSYQDKKENRVLLSFERDANFNKQGFCGASPPETGFRLLTFDKQWKIKTMKIFSTSSCITDISFMGEKKTKYNFIKVYYVAYANSLHILVVNLENSTFSSKKIKSPYDPFRNSFGFK